MMKRLFLILTFLLLPFCSVKAQTTSVTLQVTDTAGQTWNNGSWSSTLVSPPGIVPPGPPFYQVGTSTAVPNQSQSGTLSSSGAASMTLTQNLGITPSRSSWNFTVCATTSATNNCYTQFVVITATTSVTLTPPALIVNAGPSALAYTSAEVIGTQIGQQFYNLSASLTQICSALPCSSNWVSSSTVQWFNPTLLGAKHDAHTLTFNASSGVVTAITAGNCSSSDIGKNIFGITTAGSNVFSATNNMIVASCVPGTSFTVSGGTLSGAGLTGVVAWIGTDDSAAINSCISAAEAAGAVCYLPSGLTAYYVKSQIVATATTTAYVVTGDSMDTTRIVFPPFAFNANLISVGNDFLATWKDFSADEGAVAVNTASTGALVQFANKYTYRVRVSNWEGTGGGGQACILVGLDGVQLEEIESTGCYEGLQVAATNVTLVRPLIFGFNDGLRNFDSNTIIIGGQIGGQSEAIYATVQAGSGSLWLEGVAKYCTGPACNVVLTTSGSVTYIHNSMVGGTKNCNTSPTNYTGVDVVAGAIVYISGSWACSNGTGYGINNSGTVYNLGGVTFNQIGAGGYTGAGVGIAQAGGEAGTKSCTTSAATITFANTYINTPIVTLQDRTTAGVVTQTSISNTQIVVGCPGASDNLNYQVTPNPF